MKINVLALLASVTLLSSCAGFVVSPVSDSERVMDTSYDGRWVMTIAPRFRIAKSDRRPYSCMIVEDVSILSVQDGVARIEGEQSDLTTNVSSDGRFRLEMPTNLNFKKRNGLSGIDNALTIIYKGTLSGENSTGAFVHGRGTSLKSDCSTTMSIRKLT